MPFDWFSSISGGSAGTSLADLIARKKYVPAADLLKRQLGHKKKNDTQLRLGLRLQLAEVLLLDGKPREATALLSALADDLARRGFAAKSIAVLKKIQKVDPIRGNVEEKLASLINAKAAPPRSKLRSDSTQAPSAIAHAYTSIKAEIESSRFTSGPTSTPSTGAGPGPVDLSSKDGTHSEAAATEEPLLPSPPLLRDPLPAGIVDSQASTSESAPTGEPVRRPVFDRFAPHWRAGRARGTELLAVIRGLEQRDLKSHKRLFLRYALALDVLVVVLAAIFFLLPAGSAVAPFYFLLAGAAVVGFLAGRVPALVYSIVALLVGGFFILPAAGTQADGRQLIFFAVQAATLSLLAGTFGLQRPARKVRETPQSIGETLVPQSTPLIEEAPPLPPPGDPPSPASDSPDATSTPSTPTSVFDGIAPTGERVRRSPLFDSFSQDELLAVIRGLELLTFEPGDIVVTEGQPGLSLFVITTGTVKAFVRNKVGGNTQVRELHEGDFFGEISLLTGKPRTATVTATTPCEMLELQKTTLDSITQSHPRVREVVQAFYDERTQNAAEARIRGIELRDSRIARESGLADAVAADTDSAEETTVQISAADAALDAIFEDIVPEDSEDPTPSHVSASSGGSELSASEGAEAAKQLLALAVLRTKERNWTDAVLAWTRYTAVRPSDTEAINVLGIVCGKAGRWKEAVRAFEQSAQISPKDPTVFYNLGFAYSQLGLWSPAVQSYHKALALKPDYERAHQNLRAVLERVPASVD